MNKTSIKILFLVLLSCNFNNGIAQVNDAGLWASINLEKKLSKKFSVSLSEELRFNENISELGAFFTEISGEYQVKKFLGVSAGYRFSNRRRVDDSYSIRHRYLLNVNLKKKFGKFNTVLRFRFQGQYADINSSDVGKIPDNYLRTKLSFKYDTGKKITPFISGESFYHTNNPDGILFDNYRIAFGVEYDFTKRSAFELGYLINKEINVNDPWTSYVITLAWNYKL